MCAAEYIYVKPTLIFFRKIYTQSDTDGLNELLIFRHLGSLLLRRFFCRPLEIEYKSVCACEFCQYAFNLISTNASSSSFHFHRRHQRRAGDDCFTIIHFRSSMVVMFAVSELLPDQRKIRRLRCEGRFKNFSNVLCAARDCVNSICKCLV